MINYSPLYDHLIDAARAGKTLTYKDIASILEMDVNDREDRDQIDHILLDIACQENAEGRPLLSMLVVQPEIGYPWKSIFLLAREIGANNCCDERSFFSYELKRVHQYWRERVLARH
jgi:hypothetical protein